MSALAQLLQSQDSYVLGLESYSDGETELKVYDDDEGSISHDLTELSEAELKQTEIARDGEKIIEATVAMEHYADLLDHAIENGGIAPEAASFLRAGMEQYDMILATDGETVPGLEAFGGSSSKVAATKAALGGVKESIKKAWEVAKRIFAVLMNGLKDIVARVTGAAARLEKRAGNTVKKLAGMGTATAPTDKLELKGGAIAKLHADGTFIGHNIAIAVQSYGQAEALAKGFGTHISRVAGALRSTNPASVDSVRSLVAALIELGTIYSSLKATSITDGRFPKDAKVVRSPVMSDNKALYLSVPDSEDNNDKLKKIRSGFKVSLLSVPDAKAPPKTFSVSVGSLGDLKKRAMEIVKATQGIRKADKAYTELENAVKQAMSAGDALRQKIDGTSDMDNEVRTMLNDALRALAVFQNTTASVAGTYSHAIKTLSYQLQLVEREAAQFKAPALAGDSGSSSNLPATA